MSPFPERGDVWWCETGDLGRRPVVVLSRDQAIRSRRRVVAVHCSTVVRGIDTEVRLEPEEDPVSEVTVATLDSIAEYPISALIVRMGRLHHTRMRQICDALKVAVDCA